MVELCDTGSAEFAAQHLDYSMGCLTFVFFDGGNLITSYYSQVLWDKEAANTYNEYMGRLGSMTVEAQNTTQIGVYYGIDTVAGNYRPAFSKDAYRPETADSLCQGVDSCVDALTTNLRKEGLDYLYLE